MNRSFSFLFMGFVAVGEPAAGKIFQGSRESIGKDCLIFVCLPKKQPLSKNRNHQPRG